MGTFALGRILQYPLFTHRFRSGVQFRPCWPTQFRRHFLIDRLGVTDAPVQRV